MEGESRKHRAMHTLLAILKLGTVGKTQRRWITGLFTCAGGIGTDLDVLVWKSAPTACLFRWSSRVRGVPLDHHGAVLK